VAGLVRQLPSGRYPTPATRRASGPESIALISARGIRGGRHVAHGMPRLARP
jgi:hypothetical protein